MIQGTAPAVAALVAALGVASCRSAGSPDDLEVALQRSHTLSPAALCQAMQSAAARGRVDLAGLIVAHLEHPDAAVRACADDALVALHGGTGVEYRAYATPDERAQGAARWRARLEAERAP